MTNPNLDLARKDAERWLAFAAANYSDRCPDIDSDNLCLAFLTLLEQTRTLRAIIKSFHGRAEQILDGET